jgi:hypothetical protein
MTKFFYKRHIVAKKSKNHLTSYNKSSTLSFKKSQYVILVHENAPFKLTITYIIGQGEDLKTKPRQIKAKDLQTLERNTADSLEAVCKLEAVLGNSMSPEMREKVAITKNGLQWNMETLRNAQPVADSGNSRSPSSKDIAPAK